MTRWRVELFNPHLNDYRTRKVRGASRAEGERRALNGVADGWKIDEITPLCDFCTPDSIQSTEAVTRVVVIDPNDVEDDDPEAEAPLRTAWVCEEHHDVVQNLETATH